ncbi:MAG: hypothetical protein MJZ35_04070, partial [Bacteroidaceae bacterium]|nr:hypothetical protein [Bacteroidaceae bacterium]
RHDSNVRPPGYEPGELPTAPLRDVTLAERVCFPFASAKLVTFPELTKCFAENVLKNILVLDGWHKDALSVQFFDAFFAHFGVFV